MTLLPVTPMDGVIVSLQPMTLAHVPQLTAAGCFPQLWTLQPRAVTCEDDMRTYVEQALRDQAGGTSLPFVVVQRASGQVIGSTRYMDIAPTHRRLEIGATWYTPAAQRSGANVEAKFLLLTHAFDTLDMQKVVFKTERLNAASRAAILALGATEEGTLRSHFLSDAGRPRDMVYFSILDTEWPRSRELLRTRLKRNAQ